MENLIKIQKSAKRLLPLLAFTKLSTDVTANLRLSYTLWVHDLYIFFHVVWYFFIFIFPASKSLFEE